MKANAPTATSLKLDAATRSRVRRLATLRRRSPHWVMKEAITTYLGQEEAKEALRREAWEAWEDYKNTGLHCTNEEMCAWLESWGTENELPPPEPHL